MFVNISVYGMNDTITDVLPYAILVCGDLVVNIAILYLFSSKLLSLTVDLYDKTNKLPFANVFFI